MKGKSDYYEVDILSDDHAIELSSKLHHERKVRHIRFVLNQNAKFTNEGLKAIARSMRELPDLQTFYVMWGVDSSLSDESIFEVVKVLYLEGNLQRLDEINFSNERAQFLFDCFRVGQNDTHVKQIRIPSNAKWQGKNPSIEFAVCLHGNTHLQTLTVDIDADFTPNEASALAAAMCNSQTTELRIFNSFPPFTTMKGDLFRILCRDGIQASGRIWECLEIDLNFACVDDMSPVADVIPFVTTFRICDIGRHLPTRHEVHCLFEGLERSCNLVRLGLVRCGLDADDMRMLCRALRHHRSLKELDIDRNTIGDDGVAVLIEHWDEHPILESLGLYWTDIGSTGIHQLMNAVVNSPSMKVLKMDRNELGFNGFQMIGEQLPNLRLKVLSLCLYISPMSGNKQLAYQSLLRGLKANYFLRELMLPDCFLWNELMFYIALSKHGRYLVTDANAVAPTVWCTILAKCGRGHYSFSSSMVFYFLREQPHLMVTRAQSMTV